MVHSRELLRLRGEPASFLLADLSQTPLIVTVETAHPVAAEVVDVRDDAIVFDSDAFAEAESGYEVRLAYNEATLAPRSIVFPGESDSGAVELTVRSSRYSAFRAAADLLARVPIEVRVEAMRRERLGVPTSFSHTLGVNCTLETADKKLLSTVRSPSAGVEPALLSLAMSEGSSVSDANDGSWHPTTTALRGFLEELGLHRNDLMNGSTGELELEFHSLIAQVPNGGVAILGHACTSLTSDEVAKRQASAVDAHEAEQLVVTNLALEDLERLLLAPENSWVSWAPAAILAVIRLHHGAEAADLVAHEAAMPTTTASAAVAS